MGTTSDIEGMVDFDLTMFGDYWPHDVLLARLLTNNAEHFSDMDGQVRVANPHCNLTTRATLSSTTEWYPITSFGPFPLRVDSDGVAFPLRARMAGSASTAVAVKLRCAISPYRIKRSEMIAAAANVLEVGTSSTTGAWLTATTGASGTTILQLSSYQTDNAFAVQPTVDAIGGDPATVRVIQVVASIWGQTTNINTLPELRGLYLAEFAP